MNKLKNNMSKVACVLLIALVVLFWFAASPYDTIAEVSLCFRQNVASKMEELIAKDKIQEDAETEQMEQPLTIADVVANYNNKISFKRNLIDISGFVAKKLGMRALYKDSNVYVGDNNYTMGVVKPTSTDYEYQQVIELKKWLDKKDINLVYVCEPDKYIKDEVIAEQFGAESYSNRNADLLLSRLTEAGVDVVDLRQVLVDEDKNVYDMFYHTDHHWKVTSGKWAAQTIAKELNTSCGYKVDLSLYDDSQFEYIEYKNAWLGEQGRKVGKEYVGLDDYTEVYPLYDTKYSLVSNGQKSELGDFKAAFINENIYNTSTDVYEGSTWHYSYDQHKFSKIINDKIKKGNIFIIGASMEQVTVPFLSLGVHSVSPVVLRDTSESVRTLIDRSNCDTVIITYSTVMIGAHDNPESANYRMFDFE